MDVRIAIAAFDAVDGGTASVSEVCVQLGCSRDTFYRLRSRFRAESFPGLLPRFSRPGSSPLQTPPEVVAAIVAARAGLVRQGWDNITGRRLFLEVADLAHMLSHDINTALNPLRHPAIEPENEDLPFRTELIIIDEADRLKTTALEQLRDFFDRTDVGVILIGMPGFDRQLARYPQLYSRIGFAHQYRPLDAEDIPAVLHRYWQQLEHSYQPEDADHVEAVTAITTITGGNFRLSNG